MIFELAQLSLLQKAIEKKREKSKRGYRSEMELGGQGKT